MGQLEENGSEEWNPFNERKLKLTEEKGGVLWNLQQFCDAVLMGDTAGIDTPLLLKVQDMISEATSPSVMSCNKQQQLTVRA